ncbi:hypothetical protein FFF34_015455 [Inquilinus sp. KBS0705]|nr:hypothetical protein FFF34_015455 [Inquilinus sp. KBS0705]
MYLKRTISGLLTLLCLISVVYAQQTIKGTVYRKISSERLSQVLVTNLHTKAIMMSDELGGFTIKATIGDTLVFDKNEYTPQRQIVTGYDMVVYMQPEIQLGGVTIKGQTKKQELNEIMSDYRKQGTFYNGKPPALSFLTSPLTGIYELFGKTPGRAKKFAQYTKMELEATEVDRRYNKSFVKRVTGLNDSTVVKFMQYYRPTYDDLKLWNDYDLINHIKSQLEYYRKNGEQADKLEKLY